METEYICGVKHVSFGPLTVVDEFRMDDCLEFWLGHDGEGLVEREEVVKLRDYLTDLINKYEGAVIADA